MPKLQVGLGMPQPSPVNDHLEALADAFKEIEAEGTAADPIDGRIPLAPAASDEMD